MQKGTRRHWAVVMSGCWASFNHALWKLWSHSHGCTQSLITSFQAWADHDLCHPCRSRLCSVQIPQPKIGRDVLLLSPSGLPPEVCQNAQRVSDLTAPSFLPSTVC